MAKRYKMRLVLKQRFSEFFQEKVQKEQHRSLMMKMMALEVSLLLLLPIDLYQLINQPMDQSQVSDPLLVLQPFSGEDASRQESQSPQEYSHAEEHCVRAGVTLPLVGLVALTVWLWSWSWFWSWF